MDLRVVPLPALDLPAGALDLDALPPARHVFLISVVVVLVVLVLAAALMIAIWRSALGRRQRDLRVMGALAPEDGGSERTGPGAAEAVGPRGLDVLRERFRARRVVLVLGSGTTVVGAPWAQAERAGAVGARPGGRATVIRRRRRAAPEEAAALAARGVDEILVAPVVAGAGADGSDAGALEVHGPYRSRGRRGPAGTAAVRGELALLSAAAAQIGLTLQDQRLRARLRRAAHHDPRSGLLNREGLAHAVRERFPDGPGAVAVVHVAAREVVGPALGADAVARALAQVADRLVEACGSAEADELAPGPRLLAQLEGDSFAVVTGLDRTGGLRALHRLRRRLARPYVLDGISVSPSVRAGVAVPDAGSGERVPDDLLPTSAAGPLTLLLARADVAHGAARQVRENVRVYDGSMREQLERRLAVMRGFADAVSAGQLSVHFQPTVSPEVPVADGVVRAAVVGAEALARWEHPTLGSLPPDEFVPVLEATGGIAALTTFVLEEALAAARRWLDADLRLTVAVNVPVALLRGSRFDRQVADALERHRVPAELLTLELTETGIAADRPSALPMLQRLRELGCRLAVDDFGTGQSSLAHLRGLPVDQLKIDKSFVSGLRETSGAGVVRAIIDLGHLLGLTVVAEGVERAVDRDLLAAMGCDVVQGFLVSRPLSARGLEGWLASLEGEPVPGGPRTLLVPGAV